MAFTNYVKLTYSLNPPLEYVKLTPSKKMRSRHKLPIMKQEKAPSQVAPRFNVRLPEGMREQIQELAKRNNRSMNAEIVAMLKEALSYELATYQGVNETVAEYGESELDDRLCDLVLRLTQDKKRAILMLVE